MAKKDSELRPIMTRLREGLRRRLEAAAKASGRSMNAEINHRLEMSFNQETTQELGRRLANEMISQLLVKYTGAVAALGAAPAGDLLSLMRLLIKDPDESEKIRRMIEQRSAEEDSSES